MTGDVGRGAAVGEEEFAEQVPSDITAVVAGVVCSSTGPFQVNDAVVVPVGGGPLASLAVWVDVRGVVMGGVGAAPDRTVTAACATLIATGCRQGERNQCTPRFPHSVLLEVMRQADALGERHRY